MATASAWLKTRLVSLIIFSEEVRDHLKHRPHGAAIGFAFDDLLDPFVLELDVVLLGQPDLHTVHVAVDPDALMSGQSVLHSVCLLKGSLDLRAIGSRGQGRFSSHAEAIGDGEACALHAAAL